jgi:hypothetical protein
LLLADEQLKLSSFASDVPPRSQPERERARRRDRKRPEDYERIDPPHYYPVQIITLLTSRLTQDPRSLVELVHSSFNAGSLLRHNSLVHDACGWIKRWGQLLGTGRRGERDKTSDRNRTKDAMCSCQGDLRSFLARQG